MSSIVDPQKILQQLSRRPPFELDSSASFFVTLGKTGSGKNFDVNFQRKGMNYILKEPEFQDKNRRRPRIGNDGISCTQFADLYFDKNKYAYYDCAGYFDTKGVYQQILNGLSNAKIFQSGRKVKLILVIDINSLFEARGKFIHDFVQLLRNQFGSDAQTIACSTMIVISKASSSQYELEDIQEHIEEVIDTNTSFDQASKFFLHVILKNKRIVLFPLPTKNYKRFIERIKTTAYSLGETILTENAKVSMSDDGFHALMKLKGETESKIKINSKKICAFLDEFYQNQVKANFTQKYQMLTSVKNSFERLKEEEEIVQIFNFLKIPENLIQQFVSCYSVLKFCLQSSNYQLTKNVFEVISGKIAELLSYYRLVLEKNSSKEKKQELEDHLKKVEEEMKAKYMKKMEQIKKTQQLKLKQIEKQKEGLKQEYQDFEARQKAKVQKLQQELKNKQEEYLKQEQQLRKQQNIRMEKYSNFNPSSQNPQKFNHYDYQYKEKELQKKPNNPSHQYQFPNQSNSYPHKQKYVPVQQFQENPTSESSKNTYNSQPANFKTYPMNINPPSKGFNHQPASMKPQSINSYHQQINPNPQSRPPVNPNANEAQRKNQLIQSLNNQKRIWIEKVQNQRAQIDHQRNR